MVKPRSFSLILGAAVVLSCVGIAAAEPAASLDTPQDTVRSLHQGIVAAAQAGATARQRFDLLMPIVSVTHDTGYIAELTVRRAWPEFTAEQRQRFTESFEALSAMTYASRFPNAGPQTFEISSDAPEQSERHVVHAVIHPKSGEDVTLEYLLHRTESGWQIINIVAAGVSDLALKRAEYRRILADGAVDDLISHVQQQISDLE